MLKKYENAFSEALHFKYKLKANSIEISFNDEDEIEAFLSLLAGANDKKPNTLLGRMLK